MGTQLYPGIAFSPSAALTDNVGAGDTIIPVSDVEAFPPAPNLATIGTDEEGETILYAAKTATALSGCTRGVEGTARAWSAGEPIARNWTAKDHGDLITAVEGAAEAAQNTQDALAEHQADDAAHGKLFAAKQPKLTGAPGQVVGFNAQGAAQAVQGWSNPNLMDNWYFADPVNQRGQTEYTTNGYTIDRWFLFNSPSAKLLESGVKITANPTGAQFIQRFPLADIKEDTLLTLSFLDADGELTACTGKAKRNKELSFSVGASWGWIGFRNLPQASFWDAVYHTTVDKILVAAKLELGSVQTLAHKEGDTWVLNDPPPNKALELAKCQRYFVQLNYAQHDTIGLSYEGSAWTAMQLSIPTEMRLKNPAMSFTCSPTVYNGVIISNFDSVVAAGSVVQIGVSRAGTNVASYFYAGTDGYLRLDANL